jgi:hypothetical protein
MRTGKETFCRLDAWTNGSLGPGFNEELGVLKRMVEGGLAICEDQRRRSRCKECRTLAGSSLSDVQSILMQETAAGAQRAAAAPCNAPDIRDLDHDAEAFAIAHAFLMQGEARGAEEGE